MRNPIVCLAVIALSVLGASNAQSADVSREEAIRILEENYGEVSVETMVWTLNPRRPDHLELFLAAGIPATTRLKMGEGEDAFDVSLLQYTLRFACDDDETAAVVQILVDAGVDPSEPNRGNTWTPLMESVECVKVVDILLRAGADPNYRNERGRTALYGAMFQQVPEESVRLLIEHGADVKGDRERLLKMAERQGSEGKKRLLEAALAKPDPADLEPSDIRWAIGDRNVDVVRPWLEAQASSQGIVDDRPALLILTERCSATEAVEPVLELTDLILASGADVNVTEGAMLDTPLHVAARRCQGAVVKRLVDAGANIDAKNAAEQTPLFLAVFGDNAGAAEVLLDAGAKVDRNTKFFAKNKPVMKELLKKKR